MPRDSICGERNALNLQPAVWDGRVLQMFGGFPIPRHQGSGETR